MFQSSLTVQRSHAKPQSRKEHVVQSQVSTGKLESSMLTPNPCPHSVPATGLVIHRLNAVEHAGKAELGVGTGAARFAQRAGEGRIFNQNA